MKVPRTLCMTRPVRIAVVGVGDWGRNIVRVLAALPGAALNWVCDTNADRLGASGALPNTGQTTSYRELLNDREIDAIVLATPSHLHAIMALKALRAGKHVFIEKPMSLGSDESGQLVRAARSARRVVMVGQILYHHSAIVQLRRWISEDRLGALRSICSTRLSTSYAPSREGPWWSLAPHDVGLGRHLIGADPTTIEARRSTDHSTVTAELRYPGGVRQRIVVGNGAPEKVRRILVVGSSARAVFDDLKPAKLELHKGTCRPLPAEGKWEPDNGSLLQSCTSDSPEPLAAELTTFLDAIRYGTAVDADVKDGHRIVVVLEGGARSWTSGVPIQLRYTADIRRQATHKRSVPEFS